MPRPCRALISFALALFVTVGSAWPGPRLLSADGSDNAIGQLDPLGIRLACGSASASQTRTCLFTFIAPLGARFPSDASAEAAVLDSTGATATVACDPRGPSGSALFACSVALPPGLATPVLGAPLTYSLLLLGGGQAQSICGWFETGYPPGPCGSS